MFFFINYLQYSTFELNSLKNLFKTVINKTHIHCYIVVGDFCKDAGSSPPPVCSTGPSSIHPWHSDHIHSHWILWLLGITHSYTCLEFILEFYIIVFIIYYIWTIWCMFMVSLSSQGNKGGVSVRFSFYGHMMCFLNCHLASHMNYAIQRVREFEYILSSQEFDFYNTQHVLDHKSVLHLTNTRNYSTYSTTFLYIMKMQHRTDTQELCFIRQIKES